MMGHISDRTLDSLLDGSLGEAGQFAIGEHVRRCNRCATRLREWELLFPQINNLAHPGEHPPAAAHPAAGAPHTPSVYLPEWTPSRASHALPTLLAWGLVLVLAAGAGYLILQKTRGGNSVAYLPESYDPVSQPGSMDSAGLGSGISTPVDVRVPPDVYPESGAPLQSGRDLSPPIPTTLGSGGPELAVQTPGLEAPGSYPAEEDSAPGRTAPVDSAAPGAADTEPPTPLPSQFQRVTLAEAISRLDGNVRLIQGLSPEAVEIAQGSALPGADPGKAVVRMVFSAPEGRLILDQQRLGRSGGREPTIAISTAPNGVSVAQWVDRGGFWLSLAGRADQKTLLAMVNRIR